MKIKPLQRFVMRLAPILFGGAIAINAGCATPAPVAPSTEHRALFDKLAVVAGTESPEISLRGFAQGKGEGAARGAGRVYIDCAEELLRGNCSGAVCGATVVLWLGVCGVASVVGGIAGAAAAPSADDVRASEARLIRDLSIQDISQSLRDQVASAARAGGTNVMVARAPEKKKDATQTVDYRPLEGLDVKAVLETTLTHAGTRGTGINDPVQLYMQARVRLVQTYDNREIFSNDYEYAGEKLPLAEWSAVGGNRMQQALVKGYESLGAHIYESVFLLYPFPDQNPHGIGMLAAGFGLAPIQPVTRGQLIDDDIITNRIAWTTVSALRPKLEWQAFPRASDIATSPGDMKRVKNVRYDLVIARERNLAPAEIVYQRRGLVGTTHRIEKPLARATRYFWTVRARFELDGQPRLTEWGSVHFKARANMTAPSQFSYRFKTPG